MDRTVHGRRTLVKFTSFALATLFYFSFAITICSSSWDEWWTYDGISGTDFWGLLNPDWKVCDKGRRQSPINVQPSGLLYDPHLRTLVVDKQRIKGYVQNNGHSVVFRSEGLTESDLSASATNSTFRTFGSVNITGGPLSYTYTVDNVQLHFGRSDAVGSEHSIGGVQFPGELQIMAYNSDLYVNISDASRKPSGLSVVALLIQLGDDVNNELLSLTSKSHHIKYRGQNSSLTSLSISELISDLESFMTYEGSLTTPGCYETVTWIIINKPLIMSRQQFYALRKLMQGEQESPKAPLGNNFRPIQNTNSRVIRTSIDFKRKQTTDCPTMKSKRYYELNSRHSGHESHK